MIKGYIFKDDGMWKWATLATLTPEGEALCEVQGEYDTWAETLDSLIVAQLQAG